ncbi:uncharacterized protein At4g15545-like [Phalaenopsis equestris]|uniref:uncharacterized protein At4g15545-like n=1 Tax=Phalaenopsis equestris TaxID=78828 RepID=UPI0009E58CB1|nr:uncharacterized protein At4g15545-like [Phalaenopsis equestris]
MFQPNYLRYNTTTLEVFKKTLMQSLKEEDENSQVGASRMAQIQISKASSFPSGEEDSSSPPSKSVSASETVHAISNDSNYCDVDASKHGTLRGFDLASHGGTPRLTPPGSPPRIETGLAPKILSRPISPRRHSISAAAARNMIDDRPGTRLPSMASSFETGAQTGRTKVDGKEFFRQVRSRLSYEQFSTFLANVKELNSHKQTRGIEWRRWWAALLGFRSMAIPCVESMAFNPSISSWPTTKVLSYSMTNSTFSHVSSSRRIRAII